MPDAPLNAAKLLAQAGLRPKKSWGQNFLVDPELHRFIADAAVCAEDCVVELGAGLGALTYYLLGRAARVVAVERDRELVPLLRRNFADFCASDRGSRSLQIVEADAATIDYRALSARLGDSFVLTGNLPYQLASRILVSAVDAAEVIPRMVVMVQREVAERICASPGGREWGLLSVLLARRYRATYLRTVSPHVFHPPPRIDSAIVRLERVEGSAGSEAALSRAADETWVAIARAAFAYRRKTLRNALARRFDVNLVEASLQAAGIDANRRAETLHLCEWRVLARCFLLGTSER